MELKVKAVAGTLESSDIHIIVEPNNNAGIEINLESAVLAQFGDSIKEVISETLKELGVESVKITANDKGAIDPVIKSRLQTAVLRSAQITKFQWK
ncbi:citrate lyase subunit gamma (acyl carrier protein) [Cetobacterium ceti]|uniref:Citrate lyase acyl carrier protein n=1 Tax=Cetobacterium ceti TaxID=180163 RepID=A0A1T4KUS3_9FUSO|nr:citrate lyase acyl carrier protein [Cetobacterium ceti]SJZ46194.1 citrate lyase subunit gamma (acyl carrier protein) [Cetobacterium ceti]